MSFSLIVHNSTAFVTTLNFLLHLLIFCSVLAVGRCEDGCPALQRSRCIEVTCRNATDLTSASPVECLNKELLIPQGTIATYRCLPHEGKDDGNRTYTMMCICHGKWMGIQRYLKFNEWCSGFNDTGPFVEETDANKSPPEEILAATSERGRILGEEGTSTGTTTKPGEASMGTTVPASPTGETVSPTTSAGPGVTGTPSAETVATNSSPAPGVTATAEPGTQSPSAESSTNAGGLITTSTPNPTGSTPTIIQGTTTSPAQGENTTFIEGNNTRSGVPESRSLFKDSTSNETTAVPFSEGVGSTSISPESSTGAPTGSTPAPSTGPGSATGTPSVASSATTASGASTPTETPTGVTGSTGSPSGMGTTNAPSTGDQTPASISHVTSTVELSTGTTSTPLVVTTSEASVTTAEPRGTESVGASGATETPPPASTGIATSLTSTAISGTTGAAEGATTPENLIKTGGETTATTSGASGSTEPGATTSLGLTAAQSSTTAGSVAATAAAAAPGGQAEATSENFTDFQLVGLQLHNSYRHQHNVTEVKLNQTLNEKAQSWAEHELNEKTLRVTPGIRSYAENLYKVSGWRSLTSVRAVQEAMQTWYSSIEKYNWTNPNPTGFSQIVWANTTDIGVGVAKRDDVTVVAVTYAPRGNIILVSTNNETDSGKLFKENVFPKIYDSEIVRS